MKTFCTVMVIIAVGIGGYLRLANLGTPPLWVDEALYCTEIYHMERPQEYVPVAISHVLGVDNEFLARIPFALAGTATIALLYFLRPSTLSAMVSVFFSMFPLFVFYDRMCRPYAIAGMLLVLAWRYRWVYFAVLLTTPLGLIGIDATKVKKYWRFFAVLAVSAIALYLLRMDTGNETFYTAGFLIGNPRLWYLPLLALLLYAVYYLKPRWTWMLMLALGVAVLLSLGESAKIKTFNIGPPLKPWYSHVIYYNDWRGMPQVDLSTNHRQIPRYYTGKEAILLRSEYKHEIDSILRTQDTILVGVDSYMNHMSKWFFPDELLRDYGWQTYNGKAFVLRLTREGKQFRYTVDNSRGK